MSKTVHIESTAQFSALLSSSAIVVADFYADWCGPCRQIAPIYEQLSAQLSRPNKITFAKINTDQQVDLARSYGVKAMPTFMIFKNARQVEFIEGADPRRLSEVVKQLANEANKMETEELGGSSTGGSWLGAELPRGYVDVTNQVEFLGLELMNWDSEHGNARTLISADKPKGSAEAKTDYVESDTDEQLMIYIPFQSTLKIHSIHLTSLPDNTEDDESPSRPKMIKIYSNRPRILGFDDAEDAQAIQEVTLSEKDWDAKTGTAKIDLRIVKFQNVSSLVLFIVESEGDYEKVRLDRIRIIGESGEKRDGKIEKIASDD
ncbi:Thioredoxin-like protein 1 [Elasticomyces elasticus]|uniref:Thioredoxin-like protein 1 n=1 Tax=Exophiala sideris TaxID=1016849 RepID=A0ABR0J4E8_9EURO|nr:Thioredoxin-like protein 1 [Elasticomyces elasticus]KAK5026916.1 Thioredoxin-like protein 1 [Exophiala sideris]KAK5033920.1 Thioredoxin-like protein 1 [Exophiala sideris]KAK5055805.1 Thioredoxin-like protein 1 [Exophiala sideris]KAK5180862.1 Thioredoxin-like protein 1 [Eurotiomycetes sp. CCFEE 6388]